MAQMQLISKPADWREIIDQAMARRQELDLPRNIVLPCLPQSVIEFIAISNDPNATPKELAVPIEADSALALSLLRELNSAAVGLRQRVVSVAHAITLLGQRRTKTLVLASALQSATADGSSRLINNTQFQRENRIRAAFANRAAQAIGADGEIAYLAATLQDSMLPLLTEAFHSEYAEVLHKSRVLVEEEQERFGWNHASVAAWLMRDWGFPDELVACVLLHHESKRVLFDALLRQASVGAAVAAASLPDSLRQSPSGLENLIELQRALPEFCFLSIAGDVDEKLNSGLCDRLQKLVEARLAQGRHDRVHLHRQLGNYILQEQLAQGAIGTIYLAQHCMLTRPVAIKMLRSTDLSAQIQALFRTEVSLTSQLTSPNTVTVFDYGVTPEGLFYYVMEYIDGHTVAHIVQQSGPLPAGRVIHFLRQVCNSLAEAHSLGLVHRDLKPENLMVCSRGGVPDTIKVLDFGLATVMSVNSEQHDQMSVGVTGTPHYMAPEAITAPQTIDGRSDLYSLGAVAYFLLTGQTVFTATSINDVLRSHVVDVPERPSDKLAAPIDVDLENIVLQCLSKCRDRRPANAEELSKMLRQCRSEGIWDPRDAIQLPRETPNSPTQELLSADSTVLFQETAATIDLCQLQQ